MFQGFFTGDELLGATCLTIFGSRPCCRLARPRQASCYVAKSSRQFTEGPLFHTIGHKTDGICWRCHRGRLLGGSGFLGSQAGAKYLFQNERGMRKVTVGIRVVGRSLHEPGSATVLLELADTALCAAKTAGRNPVAVCWMMKEYDRRNRYCELAISLLNRSVTLSLVKLFPWECTG